MTFDIQDLSRKELADLRKKVDKALTTYVKRAREEARKAAEEAAREHGYKLDDLLNGKNGKARGAKNPPKYAHPENPEYTWSGRGRKPKWLQEAIDAGQEQDEFLIAK